MTQAVSDIARVETWPLARLVPYARNPRKNDHAVEQMMASIREFGFKIPVLARSDGTVVDGHLRLKAAAALELRELPVILCDEWTEAQVKAFRLLVNRSVAWADWDDELLALELGDLKALEYDLALTGFDTAEIDDLMNAQPEAERVKIPEAEDLLNDAWLAWCDDCLAGVEALKPLGVVSVGLSRSASKIHFLNALYYQKPYPRYATWAYHPHKFSTPGHRWALSDLLALRGGDERFNIERVRFQAGEDPAWDAFLRRGLACAGARQPQDFPAALAQTLINEFTPEGGRVLDPCHGWGGRLVGFLLSHAGEYVGYDPSPDAHAGVELLRDDLGAYCPAKSAELHALCFEDAKLAPKHFDFALTSPPYFDTEKYTGDEQSFRRYPAFEEWNQRFYRVLIERAAKALKPGGVFALQVGNQAYPLEAEAKAHAARAGFDHVETRASGMVNNFHDTATEEGEVILVLRKP
jgi:SAM-dependent methyltransferase